MYSLSSLAVTSPIMDQSPNDPQPCNSILHASLLGFCFFLAPRPSSPHITSSSSAWIIASCRLWTKAIQPAVIVFSIPIIDHDLFHVATQAIVVANEKLSPPFPPVPPLPPPVRLLQCSCLFYPFLYIPSPPSPLVAVYPVFYFLPSSFTHL